MAETDATQISLYDDGIGQLALTAQPDREPLWQGETRPYMTGLVGRPETSWIDGRDLPVPPGTAVRVDKDTT